MTGGPMADAYLDSYAGQSTEELLALEREFRVDSLVLAFEQAIQGKSADSISTEESYVLAVEGLEREVNNGGYSQFFGNSSGEFAPLIEAALRAIDCPKTADITRDAIAALRVKALTTEAVAGAALNEDESISGASLRVTIAISPTTSRLRIAYSVGSPQTRSVSASAPGSGRVGQEASSKNNEDANPADASGGGIPRSACYQLGTSLRWGVLRVALGA